MIRPRVARIGGSTRRRAKRRPTRSRTRTCLVRRSPDTPLVASSTPPPSPGARRGPEARPRVPSTSLAFPRQPDAPSPRATRASSRVCDPPAGLRAGAHHRSLRSIRSTGFHSHLRRRRYHGRARLLSGRRARPRRTEPQGLGAKRATTETPPEIFEETREILELGQSQRRIFAACADAPACAGASSFFWAPRGAHIRTRSAALHREGRHNSRRGRIAEGRGGHIRDAR